MITHNNISFHLNSIITFYYYIPLSPITGDKITQTDILSHIYNNTYNIYTQVITYIQPIIYINKYTGDNYPCARCRYIQNNTHNIYTQHTGDRITHVRGARILLYSTIINCERCHNPDRCIITHI